MKHSEYADHIIAFTDEMRQVTADKNHDYSVRDDAMDNFKLIGEALGCSPRLVWSVLWMKHVTAAINHMAKDKTLRSETIHGRFIDLANYALLGDALDKDLATNSSPENQPTYLEKIYHDQHGSPQSFEPVSRCPSDVQDEASDQRTDGKSNVGPDTSTHPPRASKRSIHS